MNWHILASSNWIRHLIMVAKRRAVNARRTTHHLRKHTNQSHSILISIFHISNKWTYDVCFYSPSFLWWCHYLRGRVWDVVWSQWSLIFWRNWNSNTMFIKKVKEEQIKLQFKLYKSLLEQISWEFSHFSLFKLMQAILCALFPTFLLIVKKTCRHENTINIICLGLHYCSPRLLKFLNRYLLNDLFKCICVLLYWVDLLVRGSFVVRHNDDQPTSIKTCTNQEQDTKDMTKHRKLYF